MSESETRGAGRSRSVHGAASLHMPAVHAHLQMSKPATHQFRYERHREEDSWLCEHYSNH